MNAARRRSSAARNVTKPTENDSICETRTLSPAGKSPRPKNEAPGVSIAHRRNQRQRIDRGAGWAVRAWMRSADLDGYGTPRRSEKRHCALVQPADGRPIDAVRPRNHALALACRQPRERFLSLIRAELVLGPELHAITASKANALASAQRAHHQFVAFISSR
jgi:hypothetical protein